MCGSSGWSDPAFENVDVSSLQNNGKYGVMIGNCCQSNKFDVNVCFGEKLLRENNKVQSDILVEVIILIGMMIFGGVLEVLPSSISKILHT